MTPARIRFSLGTLMLVVMWFAVGLWMNTMPHVETIRYPHGSIPCEFFGWPFTYGIQVVGEPRTFEMVYWASVGDVIVCMLLVAGLTWISKSLLRRAGHLSSKGPCSHLLG